MGTRSIIARQAGKTIHAIYCHWDGYLDGVGKTLEQHYTDPKKVAALIALGDCSSIANRSRLAPEPGELHTFDKSVKNVVVAYGRDRGETNVKPKKRTSAKGLFKLADDCGTEYVYLYRDGQWLVSSHGEFRAFGCGPEEGSPWQLFQTIAEATAREAVEKAQEVE